MPAKSRSHWMCLPMFTFFKLKSVKEKFTPHPPHLQHFLNGIIAAYEKMSNEWAGEKKKLRLFNFNFDNVLLHFYDDSLHFFHHFVRSLPRSLAIIFKTNKLFDLWLWCNELEFQFVRVLFHFRGWRKGKN